VGREEDLALSETDESLCVTACEIQGTVLFTELYELKQIGETEISQISF
jgi:hypothetical protein